MSSTQQVSSSIMLPDSSNDHYHDPTSSETATYTIRNPLNHLSEDPDTVDSVVYTVTPGHQITDKQVESCAERYSANYGVWSPEAPAKLVSRARAGKSIRLSPSKLKEMILPKNANNMLITAVKGDSRQIGHCFVCQWTIGDKRIWWITQLVVLPGFRNQRRATRMLQALVRHYDIGKSDDSKDFIGVLSSHPFTVCAVLRVFGRGVEAIPSRVDWVQTPTEYAYAPLQNLHCAPLMAASPIDYVRTAEVHLGSLSAGTQFFVDHRVPQDALRTLSYGMNKQVGEPWQWMFGDLGEGAEYLCVLEYRFDPFYDMRPRLCDRELASPCRTFKSRQLLKPRTKYRQKKEKEISLRRPVDYAHLNDFLETYPSRVFLDANTVLGKLTPEEKVMAHHVILARELLVRDRRLVNDCMNAKRIPVDIPALYSRKFRTASTWTHHPVPEYVSNWWELGEWVKDVFFDDQNAHLRLQILQAVHYEELLREFAQKRKILEKEAESKQLEEKERLVEAQQKRTNEGESRLTQQRPVRTLQTMTMGRMGFSHVWQATCIPGAKAEASPPRPTTPTPTPTTPRPIQDQSQPPTKEITLLTAIASQAELANNPLVGSAIRCTQRIAGSKPTYAALAIRPRRPSPSRRRNLPTPRLFRTPEPSLEDVFLSRYPGRMLPRNAGDILRRGKMGSS